MGVKIEHLEDLAQNMMFMREVLKERLRQMREELSKANDEEAEQLGEYSPRLRNIILLMGDLIDRIGIDVSTDDPEFAKQVSLYLGGKR